MVRCKELEGIRSGAEERARAVGAEAAQREARASGIEGELRIEREWRTALQGTSVKDREKISQLHQEVDQLKQVAEVSRKSLLTRKKISKKKCIYNTFFFNVFI